MSFTLFENVYGLTESGKKVKIGTVEYQDPDYHLVGGPIFYIDDTATGATYEFYDEDGEVVADVAVGDTPYMYKVSGTPTKDKYYVYNTTRISTGKKWRLETSGDPIPLVTSITTGDIGTGKNCTAEAMAASDGALPQSDTTFWYDLAQLNQSSGINDWYIPSENELYALMTAVDEGGNLIGPPREQKCWTSTEFPYGGGNTTKTSWVWNSTDMDRQSYANQCNAYATRSF